MAVQSIDAKMLAKMFLAAAKNLEAKKEYINELNVFPVPDGDTGTNMTLTILSAAKEVAALKNPSMDTLAKAISMGSLRGARGNSGVILSQLFRGFTKGIRNQEELTAEILAEACGHAVETAYKAVMKPKEGTILTVAKGMAEKAEELSDETDIETFLREVILHGDVVLNQTPEMLPVLKQAGVVDSGGMGLMEVVKGAFDAFLGKEIDTDFEKPEVSVMIKSEKIDTARIKFGYCTEFIILLEKPYSDKEETEFKAYLESLGDSIVVVSDDQVVKVHVHTNDPGLAIQKALSYGSLSNMKIDNMRLEHQEKVIKEAEREAARKKEQEKAAVKEGKPTEAKKPEKTDKQAEAEKITEVEKPGAAAVVTPAPAILPKTEEQPVGKSQEAAKETKESVKEAAEEEVKEAAEEEVKAAEEAASQKEEKEFGFIAVSIGEGLNEIFRQIGVDYIIEGGQTMNPSTEDMLRAIEQVQAEHIFILPNNKNIILAANQAKAMSEGKDIRVIPTTTVPQGITAIVNFVSELSVEDNEANMIEEIRNVKTGQVTYAVRDTQIDGKEIYANDIMGIGDSAILSVGKEIEATTLDMISQLVDDESGLISIYYGADTKEEDAEALAGKLEEKYSLCDVEIHSGGQPIYYYVVSVE